MQPLLTTLTVQQRLRGTPVARETQHFGEYQSRARQSQDSPLEELLS